MQMSALRSCASCSKLQSLKLNLLPVADPKVRESAGSSSTTPSRQKWLIGGTEPAAKLLKLAVSEQRRCETITALKQTGFATLKQRNPQVFDHSGGQSSEISADDKALCVKDFENMEQLCCELDYCNDGPQDAMQRKMQDMDTELTRVKTQLQEQTAAKEIRCCIEQARSAIAERLKSRFPEIFQRLDRVRQVRRAAKVLFADWLHYQTPCEPAQMDIFEQIGVIAQELFEIEPAQWTLISSNVYDNQCAVVHVRTVTKQETLQMVDLLPEKEELKAALKKVIRKLDI